MRRTKHVTQYARDLRTGESIEVESHVDVSEIHKVYGMLFTTLETRLSIEKELGHDEYEIYVEED